MFSESLKTIILFLILVALNCVKERGMKDRQMKTKTSRKSEFGVLDHTPFALQSRNHIHASSSVSCRALCQPGLLQGQVKQATGWVPHLSDASCSGVFPSF